MSVMATRRAIVRMDATGATSGPDDLAVEAPLVLGVHGGPALATIMRTPGHDLELVAGWLVAESGVRAPDDVIELRSCHDDDTDRVDVRLSDDVAPPRPRAFLTTAACGVCSADLIDMTLGSPTRVPASPDFHVSPEVLAGLPAEMRERQRVFERTGSVHAAAIARADGTILAVREDVGRHNAVDKVVGWALLEGRLPLTDHLLVVSGRVSFEIVQKAVAAGAAGLVAVSAPSSLAVDLCRTYHVLLAGLVRNGHLNVYAGRELVG